MTKDSVNCAEGDEADCDNKDKASSEWIDLIGPRYVLVVNDVVCSNYKGGCTTIFLHALHSVYRQEESAQQDLGEEGHVSGAGESKD